MDQLLEAVLEPRSWVIAGLVLDVVGAVFVLWGVAGLSDATIQKQERPLTWDMTKIGGETVALLQSQRRKARWGAVIILVGFVLQIVGLAVS